MSREVTLAGQRRRDRRGLLATTALQAGAVLVLAFPAAPALAQAPTARPTGGTVVAGQASIQQSTATTTVSQASQRAAVDWTSYDIGAQHTVVYQQPNAASMTLNRVTGPDPSQIAGKIIANGQVAIVNRSGVVFHAGSEVDVQSLVVSSANVTNRNFMAGRMVFDQPGKPDARISNAGNITVKQTGLAALVAPQVANTGVITAKMGHVVLAGGEASTVDLYGDGLMSVDVTRQVRHTPAGQTALVTNSGTVVADGGTIVLTAKAADGIVQNLVNAGGKLQANTAGGKTGTIVVAGIGGSVTIEGAVEATGRAPGTTGGTVQVAASDTVSVAAGARINASGRAGGGVVALGTTPARALAQNTPGGAGFPAGTAHVVRMAAGAKVKADAKGAGNGGTVALLSTDSTTMAGAISARGGKTSGNGGNVEISSRNTVGISGTVDTSAPHGAVGNLLLDPGMLTVGDTVSDNPANPAPDNGGVTGSAQTISAATFNGFTSNVRLQATNEIDLIGSTPLTQAHNVTLFTSTGGTININVSLSTTGSGLLTVGSPVTGFISSEINVGAALSSQTALALAGTDITVAHAVLGTNLTVGSTLTGNQRVSIQTDMLSFATGSQVITTNGTVAVAPMTSGLAMSIGVLSSSPGLVLSASDIAVLNNDAGVLAGTSGRPVSITLGDVSATPSVATASAGSLTVVTPVALAGATSLGLYSSGATTVDAAVTTGTVLTVPGSSLIVAGSSVAVNARIGATDKVALQGDTLSFGEGRDFVSTAGGIVAVAPATNIPLLVSDTPSPPSPALVLTSADLAQLVNPLALPSRLVLGDVSATPSAATATASSVTIGQALDLSAHPVGLGLYATGDITQTGAITLDAGAATPPSFTAGAGDRVLLTLANALPSIGNVSGTEVALGLTGATTVTGTVSAATAPSTMGNGLVVLNDDAGLTVTGTVQAANAGVFLSGGTVSVSGTLSAPTVPTGTSPAGTGVVSVVGTTGIALEAGSTVTAGARLDLAQASGALTVGSGGLLTIDPAATINAPVVRLGQAALSSGGATPADGTASTSIMFNSALSLGTKTLDLETSGTVSQVATAGLTVGTLIGNASSGVGLGTAANAISALGPFVSGGSFTLNDGATALTLAGNVTAGSISNPSTLSLTAGSLSENTGVAVTANVLTLDVTNGAATLGGSNAVSTLDNVSVAQGAFQFVDAASLTVAAGNIVTAQDVTITTTGTGHTLTVNGAVGACATDPTHDGAVALSSADLLTLAATVGGERSTSLTGLSIDVNTGAFVEAGRSGTAPIAGTVTFNDALLLNGGTVAADAVAAQNVIQSGGTLAANTLTAGAYSFGAGTVETTNSPLTISASGIDSGSVISAKGVTIEATGTVTDTFVSAGTVYSNGDVAFVLPGGFNQTGGTIAATGAIRIAGSADGLTGAPGTISQSPGSIYLPAGTLAAGGTLELYGLGTAAPALSGNLYGATVQVLEPNAPVSFAPAALGGAPTITAQGYTLALFCPGCATTGTPAVTQTALTVTPGTTAPDVRLDGATLTLPVSFTAGTLTLNSVGNTTQTGGVITAGTLTGTAGFTATTTPGALPTYTTAAATAGTVTLNGANKVTDLAGYTVAKGNGDAPGTFALTDAQALTVTAGSTVTAADVTITTTGTGSTLTANGPIGACATDATHDGVLALTSADLLTLAATVGGERSTALTGASIVVEQGAFVESGRSGASPLNGTITFTGPLSLTGGMVAANTVNAGAVNQTGGTLVAPNLTTTGYTFSGGTVETGGPLAISATGVAAGSLVSADGLTVTASGAAGTTFMSAGTLYSGGNLAIVLPGGSNQASFSQTGGALGAAGTLTVAGNAAGTSGAAGTISQSGGTMAAGTGIVLYGLGAGTTSLSGTLAAPAVTVAETGAPLTFAPGALDGTPTFTAPGYTLSLHCPGCDATAPSLSTTGLGLSLAGTPTSVRLDGTTVTLASAFTTGTLELHSSGNTTQTAAFTAGRLLGTAGYTPVTSAGLPTYSGDAGTGGGAALTLGNSVTTLGPYNTDGSLAVNSTVAMTVADRIVAGGNQTVALTAPSLTLNDQIRFGTVANGAFSTNVRPVVADAGTFTPATTATTATAFDLLKLQADALAINAAVVAPGGELEVAPLTTGTAVSLDAVRVTGHLSLTPADLANISLIDPAGSAGPELVQVGSLDGTTELAGSITFNTATLLSNVAATLGLYATGNITDAAAGGITIGRQAAPGAAGTTGTITGSAGGTVQIGTASDATPPNSFDVLGPFAAGAGLSVSDIATAGAGRSGLTVTGTVSSGTGDLGLLDAGAVVGGARLGGTLAVNGALNAAGHTLTLNVRDGAAANPAITTGSGGSIVAQTLTGSAGTADTGSGYNVTLNGTGDQVNSLAGFTVGTVSGGTVTPQGAFTLTDTANLAVAGPVTAKSVSLSAPNLTVTGNVTAITADAGSGAVVLTATAGAGTVAMQSGAVGGEASLTVTAPGGLAITGGTMDAPAVTLTGATTLTLSAGTLFGDFITLGGTAAQTGGVLHARNILTTPGLTFSNGDLYAGNGLSFAVPGTTLMGQAVTPASMTITGNGVTSTGILVAGGTLGITDSLTFTQTAGTIASTGNLTVAALGVVDQSGGAMESGATLLLHGAGSVASSVTGQLAGATIQVVEPGSALTFAPSVFSGTHALGGPALVASGTLTNSYVPNAQTTTLIGVSASPGGNRPAALRTDGATLTLGSGAVVIAADTIELHSAGATTQAGGSLEASTLSGTAGYAGTSPALPALPDYSALTPSGAALATVTLNAAANNIAAVSGYQAAGDTSSATATAGLILVDAPGAQTSSGGAALAPAGLALSGVVRAGVASDPLTATAAANSGKDVTITVTGTAATGALSVGGTLAGRTVTLTAAGPVTEPSGGTVVASTLAGSAPSFALGNANQVATLGAITASTGGLTFVDARNLLVAGTVSAPAGAVAITAKDGTGTVSAGEPASGGRAAATGDLTVALTGTDVVLNGAVGACEVGGAGGTVSIAASGTPTGSAVATSPGSIISSAGSVAGGQVSLALTAPGGVFVQGGTLNAPTLTFASTSPIATVSPVVPPLLTLSSGQVYGNTVAVNGAALETGGLLAANTLTVTGGLTFTGGSLYTGSGPLAISVAGGSLAGTVGTGGALTVSGTNVTSIANLFAGGTVTITDAGTFTQSSGTIAGAGVTVTAAGLVDQTGGMMESTGTLLLRAYGMGSATVAGQLAGTTIQAIEPGATFVFAPAVFNLGDTHPLRGAATLSTSAESLAFTCPGCAPLAMNTLVVNTPASVMPGLNRPAALRVDGGSLALGNAATSTSVLAADTIELHSQTATTQAASLETGTLSGTAGYAGSTDTLPVYTVPAPQTRNASGLYTAAASVSGATVTLGNAANNIAVVSGYQVRGDDPSRAGLVLQDTPVAQTRSDGTVLAANGLLLTGTVRSGPASDPLDASAAQATGNDNAITVNGAGQSLQIGNAANPGVVAGGRIVTLAAGGDVTEGGTGATTAGGIVAGTLNASAGGAVQLATVGGAGQVGNQVAVLSGISAGTGAITVQDSRSVTVTGPVSAATGVTLTAQNGAGTPSAAEGQSAGNLTLNGTVTTAAGNATLTAYGTLSGSSVSAAAGTVTLLAGGDVNVGGVAANLLTGSAGGKFTASGAFPNVANVAAATGALTLADSAALSLTGVSSGATAATLTAPSFVLAGNLYAGGTLRFEATTAGLTQNSGTVAATGPVLLTGANDTTPMPGGVTQTAGTIASGTSLTALATGDTTQQAAGTVGAPVVQVVSESGANDFGASQSATVTPPGVTVSLAGIVPSFSSTPGSVALSGTPTSVRLDGATVTLVRPVAGSTVTLHSAGNTTEAMGSSITASVLTGTAGYASSGTDSAGLPTYATLNANLPGSGSATLLSGGNLIGRLGDYFARSGFALDDGSSLAVGGTVRSGVATDPLTGAAVDASGAPLSITLTGTGSALTIGDTAAPNATLAGSTVTLTVPGAITEAPGALIAAGTLTGSASTASLAPTSGNQTVRLGAFTSGSDFTLVNGRDLSVTGTVVAGPNPPTGTTPVLTLGVAGGLDLNGGSLTAGTVAIATTGAVTETNGFIDANTLSVSASQVTANSGGNTVAVLSSAVAPGGIALTDSGSLITAGPVQASMGAVALQVGGNLLTEGLVSAGGTVTFGVGGSTTIAAGSAVSGASVTGTSGGALTVAGSVTSPGAVQFAANGVSVTGSISAGGAATLGAGPGALTEAAGASISGSTVTTTSGSTTTLAGTVTVRGALSVTSTGLTVASTATVQAGSGTVDAGTGGLTQAGTISVAGNFAEKAGGAASLSGTLGVSGQFSLSANGVTFTPGSSTTVQAGPSAISAGTGALNQAGTFSTGGGLSASAGQLATFAGTVTVSGPLSVAATGVTLSPGSQVQAGAATLAAGTGAFSQDGTLTVASLTETAGGAATVNGAVTVSGPMTLTDNGVTLTSASVVKAGSTQVDARPGTLTEAGSLTVNGNLTEFAGGLATLTGSTTVSGTLALTANGVTLGTGSTLQAGPVTIAAGSGAFSQAGTLTAASLMQTGTGPATVAGNVTVNGPMSLTDNGVTFTQASVVKAGSTQVDARPGTLTEAGSLTVNGDLTEFAGGLATLSGSTVISGALNLSANGVTLTTAATVQAGPATIAAGAGAFSEGGTLTVGSLTETAGGAATVTGTLTDSGPMTLTDNGVTFAAGSVVKAGTTQVNATSGALTQAGALTVTGDLIETAGGPATLSGNTSVSGTLTLMANGVTLSPGSVVTAGPAFIQAGSGAFSQAGTLTVGSLTETATQAATVAGTVTVAGQLKLTDNGVTLTPSSQVQAGVTQIGAGSGPFNQAGTLAAATLTESANGPATVAGTVTVNGPLAMSDNGVTLTPASKVTAGPSLIAAQSGPLSEAGALTVNGDLTETAQGSASLTGSTKVSGQLALTAGGVTLAGGSSTQANSGTVNAGGGTLQQDGTFNVSGALTEQAGAITQGGNVTAGTTLGETAAGTASIAGTTTVGSSYTLAAGNAATLSGTETAPLFKVTAPSITLADGTIVTGGVAQSRTMPIADLPSVTTAGTGLFLEAGSVFVQTGQTVVTPAPGAANSTVRVDLTMGTGSILFAALSTPQGNLTLDLGNGTAAGNIDVNTFTVIRLGTGFVSTGSANLFGTVGGIGGTAAAGASAISQTGRQYQINSCAIASVNCVILEPQVVPVGDPLKELVLDFFRDQEGDEDLLLPNVTDQGL